MTTWLNGEIPIDAMRPVRALRGQTAYLLPGAAESINRVFARCEAEYGISLYVVSAGDAFRSYDRQATVFTQRYRPYPSTVYQRGRWIVDRRVWNGTAYYRYTGAAAAVPGTSNHGKGITVDLTPAPWFDTTQYDQIERVLMDEGWSDLEGRTVSEPWHKNYTRDAQAVVNAHTLPDVTITPVDHITPDLLERIVTTLEPHLVRVGPGNGDLSGATYLANPNPGGSFRHLSPTEFRLLTIANPGLKITLDGINPREKDVYRQIIIDLASGESFSA